MKDVLLVTILLLAAPADETGRIAARRAASPLLAERTRARMVHKGVVG